MATTPRKSVTKKTVTRATAPARRVRRTGATAEVAAAPDAHAIAELAYHYFEESGYVHGHDLEHWLRAESDLRARA